MIGTPFPPQAAIDHALAQARRSGCDKSRRGVVIYTPASRLPRHAQAVYASAAGSELYRYDGMVQLGVGHNGPPPGYCCGGAKVCGEACRVLAIHAEDRAVRSAIENLMLFHGTTLDEVGDTELVHVKIDDHDKLVAGKGPCCEYCSKLLLDAPITWIWLYEATPQGGHWMRYHSTRFHETTIATVGLAAHLRVDES